MRLISCYHPQLVTNKYTGEQVLARCGKCPACLNARSAQWVQRLDQEMQQHLFTFFVTFQYDECHVPQLVLLRKEDWKDGLPAYIDGDTGQLVCLKDCIGYDNADINYCYNTKVLLVHNPRDFQLFVKKLRKEIKEKYDATIRYYAAFEYGPQTFRPHIHSLFFIDSSSLAENFGELCVKNWKYGCVFDPHAVHGSASQYVAGYVNSFARLPKIYLHPYIRQKALFSKCPPIGSFEMDEKELRRLFDTETYELTLFRKDVSKFCNVPLWRFVQTRLYPKITAFDRLSHYDRVELYRKGQRPEFQARDYGRIAEDLQRPLWRPYFELAFKTSNERGVFHFNSNSLSRFVSIIVRVANNANKFGVSVDDYVSKIEKYYDECEKRDLRDFLLLQVDYFKDHPISDFLTINSNYYICTKGKKFEELSEWQKFYLSLYMPGRFNVGDTIDYNYSDVFAYRELRFMHDKIFFDNTKRKDSNDYLLAHRDKFDNIITYNEEIENTKSLI